MRKILVIGAGGFIGTHLVSSLVAEKMGEVTGVDLKRPLFSESMADNFFVLDAREPLDLRRVYHQFGPFDEVYQLAADMGGMGFIHSHAFDCLTNNVRINLASLEAAAQYNSGKSMNYFYSSSVCVYPDMSADMPPMFEEDAIPAHPDNEYGWEKLYSERLAMAYNKKFSNLSVHIARFKNTYGPLGTWEGGREKAPAALCRKVAKACRGNKDSIEIWGDGGAIRSYTYVGDLVEGIKLITRSGQMGPFNLGATAKYSVDELAEAIMRQANYPCTIVHVVGPVGVAYRSFSTEKVEQLGWRPRTSLATGLAFTYPWIAAQVEHKYQSA